MMYNAPGYKWKLHQENRNAHPLYPKTSAVANRIIEELDKLEYLYCVRVKEDHWSDELQQQVPGDEICCYWFFDEEKGHMKYEVDLTINPAWTFIYQDIQWERILEEELAKLCESIEQMLETGIRIKQEINGRVFYPLVIVDYSIQKEMVQLTAAEA